MFIDEAGANTKMIQRYGGGPKSERVVCDVPFGHWKTTTFVGARRTTGMTAPMVADGAMNGALFLAYDQQQLIPTLQPDDLVIMENLSRHKRVGVRDAIESVGAQLIGLPPYSTDRNPIELVFSKLNTLFRKSAELNVENL